MKNPLNSPIPLIPFLILLALLFLMAGPPPSFADDIPLDHIVATINQSVITESQLNEAISDTQKNLQATGATPPEAASLRQQILDQLIDTRLELQAAKEANLTVSDEDLNKAIAQIAQRNGISSLVLFQKIMAQGMKIDRWKKEIHDQILIQQIQQQQVGPAITMNQDEIDAYAKTLRGPATSHQEYHLQDYLIALPDEASAGTVSAARKQATKLVSQLKRKQKADVPGVTLQDPGWQTLADMPAAFAKKIPGMRTNSVTIPLLTGNGFHVLRLAGIRQGKDKTPVLSATEIREQLFEQKYEVGVKKWLALLKDQATIRLHADV